MQARAQAIGAELERRPRRAWGHPGAPGAAGGQRGGRAALTLGAPPGGAFLVLEQGFRALWTSASSY
ncbi:MAG: hypothetical protein V9G22_13175 [Ottowia sp.]